MGNKFNQTLALHDNVTGILQLDQSNKMAYKDPEVVICTMPSLTKFPQNILTAQKKEQNTIQ
jgi:hypothetical protein